MKNYPDEIWVDTDLVGDDEPHESWQRYIKASHHECWLPSPVKAGYYWVRESEGEPPEIVCFQSASTIWALGEEKSTPLEVWRGYEWKPVEAVLQYLLTGPRVRIEGCQHTLQRMMEWASEGACPICLTAMLGQAQKQAANHLEGGGK